MEKIKLSFRAFLREKEEEKSNIISEKDKELDYKTFFAQKLKKYGVTEPDELSDEDKKKFFDEIENEWEGEKEEEPKEDDVNEADWDDVKNAVYDLANIFNRGKSRVTSNNSINIEVRGIVGIVVFDPSFKL